MSPPRPVLPEKREGLARRHTRWRIEFGPRFLVVLLLGLVWLGPAWWDPRFLYGMVLWDLLAAGAWMADRRRLPRPEEIIVRRVWLEPLSLATPGENRIEISHQSQTSLSVEALDEISPALRSEPPALEIVIRPGSVGSAAYAFTPHQRGDSQVGKVYLRYWSNWGLAERRAVADLEQVVRVFPNLQEAKRNMIYLIRSRQIELEKRLKRQRGLGREFDSLREYRDGDELRDVCWTAAARRGKLITKVYQVERSQTVWLVLDAGRLLRAKVGSLCKLDHAVNAALALAQVALYSGDRVGLLAYGRRPQHLLGAARGTAHLRGLLDCLALVQSQGSEADHLRAAEALLTVHKRRSLVVWITDFAETPAVPDVVQGALQVAPRHLVLFVMIGNPELAQLARQRPADDVEMYRQAAAQEIIQQRELLLRHMRQQGILTIEAEAERLSTAVVNQYLQVKERALL